jgi:hypothetical protein
MTGRRQLVYAVVQAYRAGFPLWLVGRTGGPQAERRGEREELGGSRGRVQGHQDET